MTPRERLFALEQFGIKLGLDNITALVAALNRPDRTFHTIHVGGTNGKGSVTAMVERGLRAAGHRTGRYTSPHLTDIEERIAIDGTPIARGAFDEIAAEVLTVVDRLTGNSELPQLPTFFEVTTAMAFEAFRRAGVSVGVIEVGLGGRYDATNVVIPSLTAITSIAFDHERHLGNSLGQIAFEKAGIIKPGVRVVAGVMPPEAREVIDEAARSRGAPIEWVAPAAAGTAVELALNGAHQKQNASIAVALLRRCGSLGRRVTQAHLIDALTAVEWPARLEWLRTADAADVLLDAAHNPAGAAALADYVLSTVGPLPLVCGVMRDKDVDSVIRALAPAVSHFVATTAPSTRALPARELAERIREVAPQARVESRDHPRAALDDAMAQAPRVMVAGSIFLVGPVRAQLLAQGARTVRYPSSAVPFFLN
jgi:dihydrofolate synthase/folylpolyglutamate synthase